MKRAKAKPEEVWLHQDKWGSWDFSFDPPLKRHELKMVRMVNEAEVAALRSEVRMLRADLKRKNATIDVATRHMNYIAVSSLFSEVDLVLKKKRSRK
jgi:hypothetical protein